MSGSLNDKGTNHTYADLFFIAVLKLFTSGLVLINLLFLLSHNPKGVVVFFSFLRYTTDPYID